MGPRKSNKPVAGYFRVSKARDEMSAPDIYRAQIVDYCEFKSLKLGEVLSDVDFSGRRGAKPRPGLEELVERRHEFSAIVTPKLSRFGRSLRDLSELFAVFDDDGIGLVFLDHDIDTQTSTGRLVRNIMASLAEYESDLIGDRWRDVHDFMAREGRWPNGITVPYGYRYDDDLKNIAPNKSQAKIVREVHARFASGESVRAIAKDLTARGIPARNGGQWWQQSVARILESVVYVGERDYKGKIIEGLWAPILDRKTFDLTQAIRAEQKAGRKPRAVSGKYLLSGLIFCGECGRNLHHNPEMRTRPELYWCRGAANHGTQKLCKGGAVSAHRAEGYVIEQFLSAVSSPLAAKALSAPRSAFSLSEAPKVTTDEIDDLEAKMQRLIELQLAVESSPDVDRRFAEKFDKLQERKAKLEEEVRARGASELVGRRRLEDLDELRKRVADLPRVFEVATLDEKRALLSLAIDKVVLKPRSKAKNRKKNEPRQVRIEWADWLNANKRVRRSA